MWTANQRMNLQKEQKTEAGKALAAAKKAELDSLGFVWDHFANTLFSWDERFAQLKAFRVFNGHCHVPERYAQEKAPGLCAWVRDQRRCLQKEKKTDEQNALAAKKKAELDSLGFVWVPSKADWHISSR